MYALTNDCPISGVAEARTTGVNLRALSAVEHTFVDNWAALSRAFGMGDGAGRVHAVLFLTGTPMAPREIATLSGLDTHEVAGVLETLVAYGAADRDEDGAYLSVSDPWAWFSSTIRQRARREFAPLLSAIRNLQGTAEEAHRAGRLSEARLGRITRFSRFVDQVARMLETFGGAGSSRPVMSAARTMARFIF